VMVRIAFVLLVRRKAQGNHSFSPHSVLANFGGGKEQRSTK
jgi:hypothetical protein